MHRPDDARMKGAKISEDIGEESVTSHASKKGKRDKSAGENVAAKFGRRFGDVQKKGEEHFKPRQQYGEETSFKKKMGEGLQNLKNKNSKNEHDDDNGDELRPKKSSNSHITTAADADDDVIQPNYRRQDMNMAQNSSNSKPKPP